MRRLMTLKMRSTGISLSTEMKQSISMFASPLIEFGGDRAAYLSVNMTNTVGCQKSLELR